MNDPTERENGNQIKLLLTKIQGRIAFSGRTATSKTVMPAAYYWTLSDRNKLNAHRKIFSPFVL